LFLQLLSRASVQSLFTALHRAGKSSLFQAHFDRCGRVDKKGGNNVGLFKPAWMSENKERAVKAVEKMTDKKMLSEVAERAPLEVVRKKAKDVLGNLLYKEIRSLVLRAKNGSQEAMKTLFDDDENWGSIVFQCFSDDILMNDSAGNSKTLISQIAVANNEKRTGSQVSNFCPSYVSGLCSYGNQKCSMKLEWYPVCSFHRAEFFDTEAGCTFLKGY
jgi:hypothetical protein